MIFFKDKLKFIIGYNDIPTKYFLGQKRITKHEAFKIFLERICKKMDEKIDKMGLCHSCLTSMVEVTQYRGEILCKNCMEKKKIADFK